MKRLAALFIPAAIALLLLPAAVPAQNRQTQIQLLDLINGEAGGQLSKLTQFYTYLAGSYIDSIDMHGLTEEAIRAILAELDPHSKYLTAEEMVGVKQSFDGNFGGIGVQISMVGDTLRVANTIAGGPSEKAGVLPDDRIVTVNDTTVVGMPQQQIVDRLRGPKGSKVDLEIVRPGERKPLKFTIKRDDIPLNTVDAAYKPAPDIGYIKVNRFAHPTTDEMRKALVGFGRIDALILDLRGNGGGLLGQAIEMAGLFLPANTLVVSTEGRMVKPEQVRTKGGGEFRNGKVVVLVDEFSASASEIVAGALQDWDRAVIVGRRTYGKGLVQRQFPLSDGSAVNITTSRYHTPTGRVIQRPFELGDNDSYVRDFIDRFEKGTTDSLPGGDSLVYRTLRLSKKVYGGGGIFPDYYVERDTTGVSAYAASLIRRGVLSEYVSIYLDRNRRRLQREYPDFEAYLSGFNPDGEMMEELAALGGKRGIERDDEGMAAANELVKLRLKAQIAQSVWSLGDGYRIFNESDETYLRALEIIRNWNTEAAGVALDGI